LAGHNGGDVIRKALSCLQKIAHCDCVDFPCCHGLVKVAQNGSKSGALRQLQKRHSRVTHWENDKNSQKMANSQQTANY
jgi:hypothetical protein